MEWADYLKFGVIQFIVTLGAAYLASYLRQKGKDLATREDIQEITDKIESVKIEYAKELEGLKSQLNAKFHAQTVRLEKEFTVYEDVWKTLLQLQNAIVRLNAPGGEDKDERLDRYRKAFDGFYPALYGNKPFLPEEIFSSLDGLLGIIFSEASAFKLYLDSAGKLPTQVWAEAMNKSEKNVEQIVEKVDEVCKMIRRRVEAW